MMQSVERGVHMSDEYREKENLNRKKEKHKKKKIRNGVYNVILVILLLICVFSGYQIAKIYIGNANAKKVQTETSLTVLPSPSSTEEPEPTAYQNLFAENLALNGDFKGWIVFDSGLLNLPFVQGETNDSYLRRNFYQKYDVNGTVFQDASQDLNGTNITLYGHYIYSDSSLMFSPLEQLQKQENYEANKTFHLYLENEVRDYTVCAVILYDTRTQNVPYEYGNFDAASWESFSGMITGSALYSTGIQISPDDHFVTMQTCVRTNHVQRTLVIGVETSRRELTAEEPIGQIQAETAG